MTLFPNTLRFLATLVAACPCALLAHPGHTHPTSIPPESAAHWVLEPYHAVSWLAVGLVALALERGFGLVSRPPSPVSAKQ